MDAQQRRGVGVAPLVGRQPDAVGVDAVLAIGRLGAREGDVGGGHATTLPSASPLVEGSQRGLRCGGAIAFVGCVARCCVSSWSSRPRRARGDDDPAAQRHAAADRDDDDDRRPRRAPTTTQPRFYEIQPGDTLTEIAAAFGLPILAIMEKNGIIDPNKIFAGQILELPLAAEIVVDVAAAGHHRRRRRRRAVPAITTVAP